MKSFLFTLFFLCIHFCLFAQGTVINKYSVALSYTPCTKKLDVDSIDGFNIGDKVLIIQMKGMFIDSSNTSTFGAVTNWNQLGNYELNEIASIGGSAFLLRYDLIRSYDYAFGKVQVVKVPISSTYDITTPHTCRNWNGLKGGIFALVATDSLVMHNDINTTGKGFRAGITDTITGGNPPPHQTDYCYVHVKNHGGMKGEGVSEVSYLRLNCRGPIYNGGGGGNDHNSGGGGGGNGARGGKGGKEWNAVSATAIDNGGLGGNNFLYSAMANKLYMAGGGGAANINNHCVASGGNGGGIVFIITKKLKGNGYSIIADGAGGDSCIANSGCNDGMGGGGAGGTILLNSTAANGVHLSAKGGDGGSMRTHQTEHGPGGGGGGGCILVNDPSLVATLTTNVAPGRPGRYLGNGAAATYNGAEEGDTGLVVTDFLAFIDTLITPNDILHTRKEILICKDDSVTLVGPQGYADLMWNTGDTATIVKVTTGLYVVHAYSGCAGRIDTFIVLPYPSPIVDLGKDTSICVPKPIQLFSFAPKGSSFSWNTGSVDSIITVSTIGTYWLTVSDTNGCRGSDTVRIASKPYAKIDIGNDTMTCNTFTLRILSISPETSHQWPDGTLAPKFEVTRSGMYIISATNSCGTVYDSVDIQIAPCLIDVPTGFSPNGDGQNDKLYVRGYGIVTLDFCIYNRFGQQLFRTTDKNTGWDGTFNGQDQPTEAYGHTVNATFIDGSFTVLKGNVTLIR